MGARLLTVAKEAIASLPLHGRQVESPVEILVIRRPHIGLPNEERPIDLPATPKLMNDRPVAMLTARNGRYPSHHHAQQ